MTPADLCLALGAGGDTKLGPTAGASQGTSHTCPAGRALVPQPHTVIPHSCGDSRLTHLKSLNTFFGFFYQKNQGHNQTRTLLRRFTHQPQPQCTKRWGLVCTASFFTETTVPHTCSAARARHTQRRGVGGVAESGDRWDAELRPFRRRGARWDAEPSLFRRKEVR